MDKKKKAKSKSKAPKAPSSSSSSSSSSSPSSSTLAPNVERVRTRVTITDNAPENVAAIEAPDAFGHGFDNSLTLASFKRDLKINIISMEDECLVFDMIGVDAPIANALRRILLSEVPTMAFERVKMFQNTSIIQDEVLAHRLGLIPLDIDPKAFESVSDAGEPNENNTLVFTLEAKCERLPDGSMSGDIVYAEDLEWVPQGRQAQRPELKNRLPKALYPKIIIAKLRPGQEIEAELHVIKGTGKEHAKWSPVCTASYRLMPEVIITRPVEDAIADELVKKCPMGVFDIEDLGNGHKRAKVTAPRNCSMCRECIREAGWGATRGEGAPVKLARKKQHFVFSVETTGAISAPDLVRDGIRILKAKVQNVVENL